jgi:hypothetical protein
MILSGPGNGRKMRRAVPCLEPGGRQRKIAAAPLQVRDGRPPYALNCAPSREQAVTIIIGTNELRVKLEELRIEHRDLDDHIQRLTETSPFNQLQIQRLKKRKLALKDQITKLESQLLPDIIA